MRIFVTGGTGFLGRYMVPVLEREHSLVVPGHGALDITDFPALVKAVTVAKPDVILHLAALCGAAPSVADPLSFFRVNAQGAVNVLEAARVCGVENFVFTSSLTVHGSGEQPMDEHSPHAPRHPYAAAKAAAELACGIYARAYGMRVLILRPTLVVGERCIEPHAIGDFTATAARGGVIEIYGTGDHRRDFIHPEDVASATAAAIRVVAAAPKSFCGYANLSNGEAFTMAELAQLVVRVVGGGSVTHRAATNQSFSLFTTPDAASALLDWTPRIGVEEIINRMARERATTSGETPS